MNRDEKAAVVEEIAARLGDADAIYAVDYRGISVPEAAELRSRLSDSETTFTVVKNRLAKRAAERAGTEGLDELFSGPTAIAFVKGDAVLAAKAIATFSREHSVLAYKGGILDGEPLDPDAFTTIARLPGLEVLRGQLVGLTASPIGGLARGLGQMIQGLALQLAEIRERGLVTGEAPEAPAEAGETATEPAAEEEGAEPEEEEGAEAEEEGAEAEARADRAASTNDDDSPEEPEAEAGGSDGDAKEE